MDLSGPVPPRLPRPLVNSSQHVDPPEVRDDSIYPSHHLLANIMLRFFYFFLIINIIMLRFAILSVKRLNKRNFFIFKLLWEEKKKKERKK